MRITYPRLKDLKLKDARLRKPLIFILSLAVLVVIAGAISGTWGKEQKEGELHNGLAVTGENAPNGGTVKKIEVDAQQAQAQAAQQQGKDQTGQQGNQASGEGQTGGQQASGQAAAQTQANANASASKEFFVDYRLNREKTREESAAMLTPLRSSADASVRQDAEAKWLALNSKNQQEDEIENLLKLRGFSENVVNVQPASVTVIVMADHLSAGDLKVIQDTVVRVCKIKLDRIEITTK